MENLKAGRWWRSVMYPLNDYTEVIWAHYSMSVSISERESSLEIQLEILRKQIFCVCRAKMSTVLKFVLLHSSIIRRNERVYLIKGSTKIQQQKMSESIFKFPELGCDLVLKEMFLLNKNILLRMLCWHTFAVKWHWLCRLITSSRD